MKMRYAMLMLSALLLGQSAQAQPTVSQTLFAGRAPIAQFTPVAAKCDVASCQQNCYVERSHCNTRGNGSCSSEAQICVQNCASQCR
ncbi:hypothetical protein BBB56_17020 [Candidatus Pantoea deserta]|uniref:Uncharacterized protein n=1 Tax=Candidatus Pantoea deserta TaxID=1869313 RepID=A0A3N4NYF5_9GAMM|nr:hypothetical protein [Pantoea deserta]RPD97896.1 hypothetical protein BBB56_17020 [Pantoea deserta]